MADTPKDLNIIRYGHLPLALAGAVSVALLPVLAPPTCISALSAQAARRVALMAQPVVGLASPLVDPPDPLIPWSLAVACQALADQVGKAFMTGLRLLVCGLSSLAWWHSVPSSTPPNNGPVLGQTGQRFPTSADNRYTEKLAILYKQITPKLRHELDHADMSSATTVI